MFLGSGIRKKSIPDPGSGSATLINCYTHSYTQPEDLKNRKPNKQGYGSEMETVRIPDPRWRHFGSRIRDGDSSDPGSEMETVRIPDPRWRQFGSGIETVPYFRTIYGFRFLKSSGCVDPLHCYEEK
jgi:hypothetical protein